MTVAQARLIIAQKSVLAVRTAADNALLQAAISTLSGAFFRRQN
jgi:hypothetical protein